MLRTARSLSTRKGRREVGAFIADGAQSVREALHAGAVDRIFYVPDSAHAAEFLPLAGSWNISAYAVNEREMKSLTDIVTPQGIAAQVRSDAIEQPWRDGVDELVADVRLVVVCAQIRDPGNAGTVIRCADAFGADAVVMTADSVELTNPKLIRASVGSVFHLPIFTGADLTSVADALHERGVQILAADGGGDLLDDVDLSCPTAWIMGNEAWGLPQADRAVADRVVGIPMWGQAESLNLSTAAAICLFSTASAQHR